MLPILLLAAPRLGQESWGRFSFALALSVILETVSDFGLKETTTRAVAREPQDARRYLANTFGLKLFLGIASLGLFIGVVMLVRSDNDVRWAVAILGLSAMLRSCMTTIRSVFYALDRFDLESAIMIGDRLFVLVCGAIALMAGYGVVGLALAFACGRVLALLGSMLLLSRVLGTVVPAFDFPFWRELQSRALPIGGFVVILQVYYSIDTVMLGLLRTDAETGIYNSAYRAYEVFGHIPSVLAVVLTPYLSRTFVSNPIAHRRIALRSMAGAAFLSVMATMGAALVADPLISLIYQQAYPESIRVFQILAIGFIATFPLGVAQAIAVSANAGQTLFRTAAIACSMKILVTAALVPRFGGHGAAAATVFGEALTLTLLVSALGRRMQGPLAQTRSQEVE